MPCLPRHTVMVSTWHHWICWNHIIKLCMRHRTLYNTLHLRQRLVTKHWHHTTALLIYKPIRVVVCKYSNRNLQLKYFCHEIKKCNLEIYSHDFSLYLCVPYPIKVIPLTCRPMSPFHSDSTFSMIIYNAITLKLFTLELCALCLIEMR